MLQFWAKLLDFLCLLHTHLHQLKPAFQPEKGELETMMFHRTLEGGSMVHNHKVRLFNILTASGWLTTKSIATAAPRLGPTNIIGLLICDFQSCCQD